VVCGAKEAYRRGGDGTGDDPQSAILEPIRVVTTTAAGSKPDEDQRDRVADDNEVRGCDSEALECDREVDEQAPPRAGQRSRSDIAEAGRETKFERAARQEMQPKEACGGEAD
jgi:hypothetical protein